MRVRPVIHTIGHGRRSSEELIDCLREAGVETLVDARRFPSSRRNPQFSQATLAGALEDAGIAYLHAAELGGLRSSEPGEELFACLGQLAGYAARAHAEVAGGARARTGAAETVPDVCRDSLAALPQALISELLAARGHEVVHPIRPGLEE